jgi:hypothetical protein
MGIYSNSLTTNTVKNNSALRKVATRNLLTIKQKIYKKLAFNLVLGGDEGAGGPVGAVGAGASVGVFVLLSLRMASSANSRIIVFR